MIKLDKTEYTQLEQLKKKAKNTTPYGILDKLLHTDSYSDLRDAIVYPSFSGNNTYGQFCIIDEIYGNHRHFEKGQPGKYVVRSKGPDKNGDFLYLGHSNENGILSLGIYSNDHIVRFDTFEEAEELTDPETVVVDGDENS